MALETCDCDTPLGNTGVLSCVTLPKATSMLIFVLLRDADGNFNEIDLINDTLDQAYFDDKINKIDPLERWHPAAGFKAVTDERNDPVTESVDNESLLVEEGARLFQGSIYKRGVIFAGKLQQNGCTEFGVFYIDSSGNITGDGSIEGKLRPVAINENTWDVRAIFNTKATLARVQIAYEYGSLVQDKNLRTITADQIAIDVLTLRGLLDVRSEISGISLTGYTMALTYDYWDGKGPRPFVGAVAADFDLDELSPAAGSIAISSLTETIAGESGIYDVVHPSQTDQDLLETTLDVLKLGFDLEQTRHTVVP